jgi:broad specificity phosphatase PhoE
MIRILSCTVFLVFVVISCKNQESKETDVSQEVKTTQYYLIRHAEKDRTDPENRDPKLTSEGMARAERWAVYFDTIDLDAVYSTQYVRTVMTATPTAESKQLDVLSYDPRQLYDENFQLNSKDKKVLVVGHSNTTPAFVNKILGADKYSDMDDNDNSSLFVVTLKNNMPEVEIRTVQ